MNTKFAPSRILTRNDKIITQPMGLMRDKISNRSYEKNRLHTYCGECLRELTHIEIKALAHYLYKCTECGSSEFITNNSTRAYIKNPIWKIGIELEGLWDKYPTPHRLLTQRGDCSVKNPDNIDYTYIGEYVTKPVVFKEPYLRELEDLIWNSYPTWVNRTCGGHFHISFRDMRFYDIAMDYEMYEGLIEHLQKWGKRRLNRVGMNRLKERIESQTEGVDYARPQHMPEQQLSGQGERYCHFNFDYFKHKTMEVRILPMFSSAGVYLEAVNECTHFISDYITNHAEFKSTKQNIQTEFDISGKISPLIGKYNQ
tara:strand:+ start:1425 stop:2363 length:939 start_codon:yes stop_codon:yes gene_type:complete